jgi:hypothetical protein
MAQDEMFTPKWIFDALDTTFDLDVASSDNPYVVVPTKAKYTKEDDALVQPWYGRVWLNPPFSGVTPWVDKWIAHNNGFMLVPLSSNGKWINKLWESNAACVFLPPNMGFIGGFDGVEAKHRWRCAIWALGADNVEILIESKIGRVKL